MGAGVENCSLLNHVSCGAFRFGNNLDCREKRWGMNTVNFSPPDTSILVWIWCFLSKGPCVKSLILIGDTTER